MPALLLTVFLGCCLLLVFYWLRRKPLKEKFPLNVDENLPLPWLAQTSTVFSLTALFGAYLGVAVTLGLPALTGLAFGTVVGLFAVRSWINSTLAETEGERRFEDFLSKILEGRNTATFAITLSVVQCLYATSELLIFRELAKNGLHLKYEQATLLAIAVGIIGYCYMLFGGYVALFHTDRIQLLLVSLMAVAAALFLVFRHSQAGWTAKLWPQAGYWQLSHVGPSRWLYFAHFFIAAVMGLGFLVSSPDTWKRVFQVDKTKRSRLARTLIFVGVGVLPYLVLLPCAITISLNVDRSVKKSFTLPPAFSSSWFFGAAAVGLVASFLSSFNSALLASVHVALIKVRNIVGSQLEEARFYRLMMVALIFISLMFVLGIMVLCDPSRLGFNNPWLLGNILMGAYAVISGVQFGTNGRVARLPGNSLPWIFALGMIAWFVYFKSWPGFFKHPTVDSVNTIPAGVALSLVIALSARLLIRFFGDRNG